MRGLILAGILAGGAAQADVVVEFRDGAPKDTFTIQNVATCATAPMAITIDISTAPAGLIFDVTAQGEGVEVFQPLELVIGEALVTGASAVRDGDQTLTLTLTKMQPLERVSFTIDMDDTSGAREITVSGSETAGARVVIESETNTSEAMFDDTGRAIVERVGCVS